MSTTNDTKPTDNPDSLHLSLVSNSPLLCEGLLNLLSNHLRFAIAGCYSADIVPTNVLPNPTQHVVLLDSGIGAENATQRTREWRGMTPAPLVIILEMTGASDVILACIEAGANGYTLRGASGAEVAQTILDVQRGLAQCSPQITAQLFARLAARRSDTETYSMANTATLTHRELDVLSLIVKAYTNKQIAETLVIEVRTVKHHIHNILRKLNIRHRWEAAQYAANMGVLDYATLKEPPYRSRSISSSVS